MTLRPMSPDRQLHLVKCAEVVIELTNCGADPTEALTKVATEGGLNSHEVDLTSHKVNQALTLGHFQATGDSERRADSFPLSQANVARDKIFGSKTTISLGAEQRQDQPTGPEIARRSKEKIDKKALAESNEDHQVYRFDLPARRTLAECRDLAGVKVASAPVRQVKPTITQAKLAHEKAREAACLADQALDVAIHQAIQPFTYLDAPRFAQVEKVAAALGVQDETVGIVYQVGRLQALGHPRADLTKVAGLVRPTGVEQKTAVAWQVLERAIKLAAETSAQAALTREALERSHQEVRQWTKRAGDAGPAPLATLGLQGADTAPGGVMDDVMGVPEGGNVEDTVGGLFGLKGEHHEEPQKSLFDKNLEQGTRNTNLRGIVAQAMNDPYISGHPINRVIDSVNRANALEAHLSEPELLQYVKQDLATDGGVPLDLQLKTVQAHKDRSE